MSVYLATFVAAGLALMPHVQWAALLAVVAATAATIRIWERGRWNLGIGVAAGVAIREAAFGILFAAALITVCDVLIVFTTDIRQARAGGLPSWDLVALFVPAALHEELAFRGYVYQKLRQWSRGLAVAVTSIVFAVLHSGNAGASPLAIVNILIAGVLLALAYERYRRLWFPIGIHFAWNVMSGPVLGFPVSGFVPRDSVLRVAGSGPELVTGGTFGIEASIWMTVMEVLAIALLFRNSSFRFERSSGPEE